MRPEILHIHGMLHTSRGWPLSLSWPAHSGLDRRRYYNALLRFFSRAKISPEHLSHAPNPRIFNVEFPGTGKSATAVLNYFACVEYQRLAASIKCIP